MAFGNIYLLIKYILRPVVSGLSIYNILSMLLILY